MPFAKTWTEELVAEWLQLNGYLVEAGLPAGVTAAGEDILPMLLVLKLVEIC